MQPITSLTLGDLLTSTNETIRRNAISILKVLQQQLVDLEKQKSSNE